MEKKAEPVHKLFVKNMVCDRCSMVVRQELEKIGMKPLSVALGEIALTSAPTPENLNQISESLSAVGFSVIDDRKARVVEQIKTAIMDVVHRGTKLDTNLSNYLARQTGREYSSLSNLFSEVEGVTIEHYFIRQKIEKTKELLLYGELTLSQIASELGYSSVAHLSNQFKKVTGLTPSQFRSAGDAKRRPIDKV